jgi:predicted dinucleotide-binding enzyme
MSYKTLVSMNIAVIGGGRVSEALSRRLAIAGHEIFIGLKDGYGAIGNNLLLQFDNIHICSVEEAAYVADIIIMATDANYVREAAYWLDDVRRKVIIDATDFIPSLSGGEVNTVNAIKAITGSPHVVKIFNNSSHQNILSVLLREELTDMYVSGDSKKAKELVKILARDMWLMWA